MTPTDIIAILGLIATALVSIFSKVSDRPLTAAQASSAEADATTKVVQSYESLLTRLETDNKNLRTDADTLRDEMDKIRDEFRREKADCRRRIAKMQEEIDTLKNGGAILPAPTH